MTTCPDHHEFSEQDTQSVPDYDIPIQSIEHDGEKYNEEYTTCDDTSRARSRSLTGDDTISHGGRHRTVSTVILSGPRLTGDIDSMDVDDDRCLAFNAEPDGTSQSGGPGGNPVRRSERIFGQTAAEGCHGESLCLPTRPKGS